MFLSLKIAIKDLHSKSTTKKKFRRLRCYIGQHNQTFCKGLKEKQSPTIDFLIDIESDPVMFLNHLAFEWVTFVCIYLNALVRLINPIFHSFQLKGKMCRQIKRKWRCDYTNFPNLHPSKLFRKSSASYIL